jgi:hypothetical protein
MSNFESSFHVAAFARARMLAASTYAERERYRANYEANLFRSGWLRWIGE